MLSSPRVRAAFAALTTALLLASCGGGGSSPSPSGSGSAGAVAACPPSPVTLVPTRAAATAADQAAIDKITVSADATPTVVLPKNTKFTEVTTKVITQGTGPATVRADTVSVRAKIYNGATGKLLDDGFAKGATPAIYALWAGTTLEGLTRGLLDVKQGDRIIVGIPAKDGIAKLDPAAGLGAADDSLVMVADIEQVIHLDKVQTPPPADVAEISFPCANGAPVITIPAGAKVPTTTKVYVLTPGTGEVVKSGQEIMARYHGVVMSNGVVFDSSWSSADPLAVQVGTPTLIAGWNKALPGLKVGSRVLLVIPPAEAYKDQPSGKIPANSTLVFMIDVLAARTP